MASLRKRGKHWYYRFTDSDGGKHERRGCPDKRATEQMAAAAELEAAKIRGGLIDPKEVAFRDHAGRPLSEHLDEWQQDMLAKGMTPKHADLSRDRAGKLIAMVKGVALDDLVAGRKADAMARASQVLIGTLGQARFSDLTAETIQAALARLTDEGRSAQTANHFRAAIRPFLKWCHRRGRVRTLASDGVEGLNVEEDLRHVRSSLADEELARLIHSAESGPDRLRMSGPCERSHTASPPTLGSELMS